MARPGFVLETDDRTPPLVVADGAGFRLEKFPLGTRVVYAAESLAGVVAHREAIGAALDAPQGSAPLSERLRPGMSLTIAFDDISVLLPQMRKPDVRGVIIEEVLTRAAQAGVDDVALVSANGLSRRNTEAELVAILGERVFRSFFGDGLLTHHDAEDPDLTVVGSTAAGDVALNARAATSDLLVYVHVATYPHDGGAVSVATGLGSTATISQISGLAGLQTGGAAADAVAAVIADAVPVFSIEAVLDQGQLPRAVEFLAKREWEWSLRDQGSWIAMRQGLALSPRKARRRFFNAAQAAYALVSVDAGDPTQVRAESARRVTDQQLVQIKGQADVGIIGVGQQSPYSVDSVTNPVLAAWLGLGAAFGSHTGTPFVREGGALVLYHPLPNDFSPLHHPSYVDFFADVLTTTTDPVQIQEEFEAEFTTDPWYTHLYRTGNAFHGVHPFHLWYQIEAARRHCGDIIWVGADRSTVERMGFRAASTLQDALEIASSSVGRTPSITYLHQPHIIADVV